MKVDGQRDTFLAEFMLELAQVDELFRYQITKAQTPEQALHDIAPIIRFIGDVTGEDERRESGAERRLMFRTAREHDFYLYEDDPKLWLDVSRLDEGEQGSAIYAALFDYAANADRRFIGDPAGLSDIAVRRRTEAMLSSALKHGSTDHMEPHPRQIDGAEVLGVPPLSWHDGDTLGNMQSLIDVSLASLASRMPEFQRARYDFASRTFRTGEGEPLTDEALARWAHGQGRDREAGAGRATYKRGILLNTLACAESGERPGLLERVLSQPRQLVGTSAEGIFY